uniref:Ig-like domain-containing protein n=1 Tax=Pelusios castaneus TaxID=367368 RepID=A0A8C8RML9_9SAUR
MQVGHPGPSSHPHRPQILLPLQDATAAPVGVGASITLRLLLTTVFPKGDPATSEGIALLGDLETHYLDFRTTQIRFLQPWARQGLTPKEWQDLETMIPSAVPQSRALHTPVLIPPALLVPDPFVTQFSSGCELHPNGTLRPFCDAGLNGEDFISLNVDMGTWVTRSGDKLALDTRDILNYNKVVIIMLQFLLRTTCVNEIRTFVQFGKESLEREERPVAVVFAREPPAAGTPSSILVVCRVTGFYPRPIRVSWLQDGEEVVPGWRLNSTGILPNADLTYQLRSSLAVEPGDGHSYACRVEHVSLGGHSLLIPWRERVGGLRGTQLGEGGEIWAEWGGVGLGMARVCGERGRGLEGIGQRGTGLEGTAGG